MNTNVNYKPDFAPSGLRSYLKMHAAFIAAWHWLKSAVRGRDKTAAALADLIDCGDVEPEPASRVAYSEEPKPVSGSTSAHTAVKASTSKVEVDRTQANYYLGDLLDELDEYFSDIAILKKCDSVNVGGLSKIGVSVVNKGQIVSTSVEPYFLQQLPATGAFYFSKRVRECEGKEEPEDYYGLRLAYFQKVKRQVSVQATDDAVYSIVVIWGTKRNKTAVGEIFVGVSQLGEVKLLKTAVATKHQSGRGRNKDFFTRVEWHYPAFFLEQVKSWNKKDGTKYSPDHRAAWLLALFANYAQHAEMGINVRVKKGGNVAQFSIDMLRTPYFFNDRQKVVNENGNTKPILHIVRPHERILPDGTKKIIKSHWRGLRRFGWNGYDVSIGMPGKHFNAISTFSAASVIEDEQTEVSSKMIDFQKVGKLIDDAVTAQFPRGKRSTSIASGRAA